MWFARLVAIVTAIGALLAGSATSAIERITDAVTVEATARRDVAFAVDGGCDLDTARALASRHPEVRQLVVMATDSWSATRGTVEVAVRTEGGEWRCQLGPRAARYGRNGTRPLVERRSGDGTTPAGVFPLGRVEAWDGREFSVFGNRPDPGVLVPYRDVRREDCWGATPGTGRYQHLVDRPGCSGPDEWLTSYGDAYSHAAVIGANLDPISGDAPGEPPYAAAIFLHRTSYTSSGVSKPTSGCVSLGSDDLVEAIRLLDGRLAPHFAIGPRDWLRTSA